MSGFPSGRWAEQERWWQKKGDDLAKAVWAIAGGLESDQTYRLNRARESLALYEGRKLAGVLAQSYTLEAQYQDYDLNVSRAGCDTVISEIAGRQKPMPKFQTSDADWKTKRRGKKLEEFCLAVLNQSQGPYLNAWELMESVFLDACIWGEGIAKVFYQDGAIKLERHYAYELFVDPVEARYGDPKNLFHVYTMERDLAIWTFAKDPALNLSKAKRKEIAQKIEKADEVDPEIYGNNPRVAKAIKVVECWRLAHAGGTPGKHAFVINNTLLHEEDYTRDSFPFVHVYWEQDRMGWHGKGLIEQGESVHRELNVNASKLQERFRLCGAKRTYVEQDSIDMEDMQANDAEVIVEFRKGSSPPIETTPKPIADAELGWMNDCFQKFFEITGISQMRASARKEPGVTAGVAIRTLNDMQTARFALKAKGYENSYVQLAHNIIHCAREAASGDEPVKVRFDEEINWKKLDVPENTFDITIAPASSLPNDPAGRLQMAQELFSSGIVGVETFKQLLGWPDLEKEMNNQTSQNRYLEKIIDTMLDVEEDGEFVPPDPLLIDKPRALMQAAQAYFDALYDGAPEKNLQLLRDYIAAIDALIAAAMPPPPMPAAPGAAPGDSGATPGGSIPFAPPGGAPPIPAGGPGDRPGVS